MSAPIPSTAVNFSKRAFVMVTGASRGIGRAIALEISRNLNQDSIVVLLARSEEGLNETKNLILEMDKSLNVHTHSVDLSKADNKIYEQIIDGVITTIDTSGIEVGIIFHNVGSTGQVANTLDLTNFKEWQEFFALNISSVSILNSLFVRKVRPIAPQLTVVNVTSLCGRKPFENLAMYGCGKAARELFFKVLAVEEPNINVVNYSPGPVDTDMFDGIIANAQSVEVRNSFRKTKEGGGILTPETSVRKLVAILERGAFKSGDTIDYFD